MKTEIKGKTQEETNTLNEGLSVIRGSVLQEELITLKDNFSALQSYLGRAREKQEDHEQEISFLMDRFTNQELFDYVDNLPFANILEKGTTSVGKQYLEGGYSDMFDLIADESRPVQKVSMFSSFTEKAEKVLAQSGADADEYDFDELMTWNSFRDSFMTAHDRELVYLDVAFQMPQRINFTKDEETEQVSFSFYFTQTEEAVFKIHDTHLRYALKKVLMSYFSFEWRFKRALASMYMALFKQRIRGLDGGFYHVQ